MNGWLNTRLTKCLLFTIANHYFHYNRFYILSPIRIIHLLIVCVHKHKSKRKDLGNYKSVNLTSVPRKVMRKTILETISQHIRDKKVMQSSQHGFMKEQPCLTKLIAYYNEVTGSVGGGEQWMLFTSTSVRLVTLSPVT